MRIRLRNFGLGSQKVTCCVSLTRILPAVTEPTATMWLVFHLHYVLFCTVFSVERSLYYQQFEFFWWKCPASSMSQWPASERAPAADVGIRSQCYRVSPLSNSLRSRSFKCQVKALSCSQISISFFFIFMSDIVLPSNCTDDFAEWKWCSHYVVTSVAVLSSWPC